MCLISNKPPRVLLEDMIVFKGVDAPGEQNSYVVKSPFNSHLWIKDELQRVNLRVSIEIFGPWTERYDDSANKGFSYKEEVSVISEGFHSATTPDRLHRACSTHIAKFLVPAGATIYEDNSGLLVSDKAMYLELT